MAYIDGRGRQTIRLTGSVRFRSDCRSMQIRRDLEMCDRDATARALALAALAVVLAGLRGRAGLRRGEPR